MDQNKQDQSRPGKARFDGSEAGSLDLKTAARWTAAYRQRRPRQTKAHFFGRVILEQILAQPGCQGLRVYYALDPATKRAPGLVQRLILFVINSLYPLVSNLEPEQHLLIVGADATQSDQLPAASASISASTLRSAEAAGAAYIIAEMSIPCPNQCGTSNALNSDVRPG